MKTSIKNSVSLSLNNRTFILFQLCDDPNVPLVIEIAFYNQHEELIKACSRLNSPDFNLLCVGNLNWDQDLSPWPHAPCFEPNDDFTGNAPQFLQTLLQGMDQEVDRLHLNPSCKVIAGYSLGGLFALWSLYQTDAFEKVVCASGSLWYPDLLAYVQSHPLVSKPEAVYLSLGRKEIMVRNPLVQKTGQIMETIEQDYQKGGIPCIFQWNPGNHFTDPIGRLAAGLVWVLNH